MDNFTSLVVAAEAAIAGPLHESVSRYLRDSGFIYKFAPTLDIAMQTCRNQEFELILFACRRIEDIDTSWLASIREVSSNPLLQILILDLSDASIDRDALFNYAVDGIYSMPKALSNLKLRMHSISRLQLQYRRLHSESERYRYAHSQLMLEQEFANDVLQKLLRRGCLDAPAFRKVMTAHSTFNGDVLLASQRTDHSLVIMAGDFTGHGLRAAIGTVPFAEVFYAMTAKVLPAAEIILELNRKLKSILPASVFCAGAMAELSADGTSLNLWVGGMPPPILLRSRTQEIYLFKTNNLALGILSDDKMQPKLQTVEVEPGDKLYLYTDGLLEATNEAGEMFGTKRIETIIKTAPNTASVFDKIMESLYAHTGLIDAEDDMTLLEFTVPTLDQLRTQFSRD